PVSLSAETVSSIYEDRGGVLWIGTYSGGINKHDPAQERFAYYRHESDNPSSLSDDFVFSICVQPNGRVWVGTYGGGLEEFIPSTGVFRHFRYDAQNPSGLPNNYVWTIYSDSQNDLWVSTNRGLSRLDPVTERITNYTFSSDDPDIIDPGLIYAMAEDASGTLWLATRHGLGRFNREQGLFLPETFRGPSSPTIDDRIVSLLIDHSGMIWFGTFDKGLYRYSTSNRQLQNFRASSSETGALSNNSITSIFEDSNNIIWIATAGGGLNRYDAVSGTFHAYSEDNGLSSNLIYGIMEDSQGYLWMSTNSGIARFDSRTETFRRFTVNDGLGSMDFNAGSFAESPNGAMYFGTTNGLNVFRPEQIQDSVYAPPIALTFVTVEGESLDNAQIPDAVTSLRIEHPQNSFEFEFVALGFEDPERNQYAYKLEGFDQDWNLLGTQHGGRYTNVPGGEYTLLLKVANSDGVWSDDWLKIPVVVVPPYWQTTWFRLSVAAGLYAMALIGYRLRVRNVETRNRELEQVVRSRTAELEKLFVQNKDLAVIEERNRLARDLH
ncbi:MAG: two-component regulator propeller domain-containing protein, partial [Anaerolineales bacterium]|nr:two-component regulator propeller domain-containing protein [Anaerolineales bacterium]